MLWHEQRWPQLQAMDKEIPVLIPLGACEQHGLHLPLFVDTLQVNAIAEAAERQGPGNVLLLSTLWLGSSHHHLDFPGTLSLRPSLYSEVIKSVAQCILKAGFKRLLFLNGHGGNKVPVAQALSELVCDNDAADDAYLVLATWWELDGQGIAEGMDTPCISHACEYETSLILALRPDLVALEEAREAPMALENAWVKSEGVQGNRVSVFRRFHRLTASGSMGRPSAATSEKGRHTLDVATAQLVKLIDELRSWPELPARKTTL